jgi:hypothetical protein
MQDPGVQFAQQQAGVTDMISGPPEQAPTFQNPEGQYMANIMGGVKDALALISQIKHKPIETTYVVPYGKHRGQVVGRTFSPNPNQPAQFGGMEAAAMVPRAMYNFQRMKFEQQQNERKKTAEWYAKAVVSRQLAVGPDGDPINRQSSEFERLLRVAVADGSKTKAEAQSLAGDRLRTIASPTPDIPARFAAMTSEEQIAYLESVKKIGQVKADQAVAVHETNRITDQKYPTVNAGNMNAAEKQEFSRLDKNAKVFESQFNLADKAVNRIDSEMKGLMQGSLFQTPVQKARADLLAPMLETARAKRDAAEKELAAAQEKITTFAGSVSTVLGSPGAGQSAPVVTSVKRIR